MSNAPTSNAPSGSHPPSAEWKYVENKGENAPTPQGQNKALEKAAKEAEKANKNALNEAQKCEKNCQKELEKAEKEAAKIAEKLQKKPDDAKLKEAHQESLKEIERAKVQHIDAVNASKIAQDRVDGKIASITQVNKAHEGDKKHEEENKPGFFSRLFGGGNKDKESHKEHKTTGAPIHKESGDASVATAHKDNPLAPAASLDVKPTLHAQATAAPVPEVGHKFADGSHVVTAPVNYEFKPTGNNANKQH